MRNSVVLLAGPNTARRAIQLNGIIAFDPVEPAPLGGALFRSPPPTLHHSRSRAGERDAARETLVRLLEAHGDTLDDLAERVQQATAKSPSPPDPPPQDAFPPGITPLVCVKHVLWQYFDVPDPELTVIAAWVMLSFVHRRFPHTPLLGFVSPVRGCGKSTLMRDILTRIGYNLQWVSGFSAASIYTDIDANNHQGQLLDELDTHDVDKVMINLLNNIFERDGFVQRRSGQKDAFGRPRNIRYFVNCCCAYALAHGFAETKLPPTTKSRSIVIRVHPSKRKLGTGPDDLRRFYEEDAAQVEQLQNLYTVLRYWADQAQLNLDPSTRRIAARPSSGGQMARYVLGCRLQFSRGRRLSAADCGSDDGGRSGAHRWC
jgi:hypothetical protein